MFAGIQQYIIMRSMGVEVRFFGKGKQDREMEEEVLTGPGIHPEAEVAEGKIEKSVSGGKGKNRPVTPPKPKKKKKKK